MGNTASSRFHRDKSENRSRRDKVEIRKKRSRGQSLRGTLNDRDKVRSSTGKPQRSKSLGKSSTKSKSKSSQCSCCNKKYNFMDSIRKLYPPRQCEHCHREVCKKCYNDKCCHKCSTRERGDMRSITKLEEMDRNELVQILQNLHLGQKAVDIKETSELILTILNQCDMDKDFVREFETSHSKRSTPQNGRITEVEINGDQHSDISQANVDIDIKNDQSNVSVAATVKTDADNPYDNGQPRFVDTFDNQQQSPSNDEDDREKTPHLKLDNLLSTEEKTPSSNLVIQPAHEIHLARESTIRDESLNSLKSKDSQLPAIAKQPSNDITNNLKPELIAKTIVSSAENSSNKPTTAMATKTDDKMSPTSTKLTTVAENLKLIAPTSSKADIQPIPTTAMATKTDDKMPPTSTNLATVAENLTLMAPTTAMANKADDKMSPASTHLTTVAGNLILTAPTSSKAEIQPIQSPQIIVTKTSRKSSSDSSHDEADDKLLSLKKPTPRTAKSQDIFPMDEPLKTSTPLISRAVSLRSLSSVKAIEEFDIKKLRQILDRALENVTEQELATLVTSLWRIRRKLKPKEQKVPVSMIGSLTDISVPEVIPTLSIRQIKSILEKNQVSYAECSEKYEMVVKLDRLWKDMDKKAEEKEEIPKGDQCVICLTERANCVLLDCGHLVACSECVTNIKECPVCRLFIVKVIRVFKA